MGRWNLCESSAYRRQRAARAALEFPVLFEAIADGRLHLTAVALLAKCFAAANVEELIAAARHKEREDIEQLIADRYPKGDVPFRLTALPSGPESEPPGDSGTPPTGLDSTYAEPDASQVIANKEPQLSPETVGRSCIPASACPLPAHAVIKPTAPERYALQVAVRERDGDQCCCRNAAGERCPARRALEIHHIRVPEHGGRAILDNLELRCRLHNLLEAERTFGHEFMRGKIAASAAARQARRQEKPIDG
jgi:hypothetical protein